MAEVTMPFTAFDNMLNTQRINSIVILAATLTVFPVADKIRLMRRVTQLETSLET